MRETLFAYVDGADLELVAEEIAARLDAFIQQTAWQVRPTVVNQRHPPGPYDRPGDLPAWDLGLNIPLPEVLSSTSDWATEIDRILHFLGELHTLTGRDFVVGYHNGSTGVSEDLFQIESASPKAAELFAILGAQ